MPTLIMLKEKFSSLLLWTLPLTKSGMTCHGDIAKPFEKFGGRPPFQQKLNNFNHFLNTCEFEDLGYVGPRHLDKR